MTQLDSAIIYRRPILATLIPPLSTLWFHSRHSSLRLRLFASLLRLHCPSKSASRRLSRSLPRSGSNLAFVIFSYRCYPPPNPHLIARCWRRGQVQPSLDQRLLSSSCRRRSMRPAGRCRCHDGPRKNTQKQPRLGLAYPDIHSTASQFSKLALRAVLPEGSEER